MYRNIRLGDFPHLIISHTHSVNNIVGIIWSKSYIMFDDGIKGFMLLKNRKMSLQNHFNNDDVLHFLNIYQRTEFKTYEIASLYQKEDDEVIYNIFDMVSNCLNNGDYLWGKASNALEHYLYKKLGFIKLNTNIYAYQYTQ